MRPMRETIGRLPGDYPHLQEIGEIAVECNLPQADDHADTRQSLNLIGQMSGAIANLLRQRLVAGRSAADDRGNPGMAKFEAIIAEEAGRLAG